MSADRATAPTPVLVASTTRTSLPVWSWILLALPVVGWIALLVLAAHRPSYSATLPVPEAAIAHIGQLRRMRNAALIAALCVVCVGVVGRFLDTGWSTVVLGAAVVAVVSVWFVARVLETAVIARA